MAVTTAQPQDEPGVVKHRLPGTMSGPGRRDRLISRHCKAVLTFRVGRSLRHTGPYSAWTSVPQKGSTVIIDYILTHIYMFKYVSIIVGRGCRKDILGHASWESRGLRRTPLVGILQGRETAVPTVNLLLRVAATAGNFALRPGRR